MQSAADLIRALHDALLQEFNDCGVVKVAEFNDWGPMNSSKPTAS